jgi:hypothetical protein
MSFIVVFNLIRAMVSTWKNESQASANLLYECLVYTGCTGWLVMFIFLLVMILLYKKMQQLTQGQLKRSTVGSQIVPFGDPLRCVEFIQAVLISLNYYTAVFVAGIIGTLTNAGDIAAAVIVFLVPIVVVVLFVPFMIWALAIMSVLGSLKNNPKTVQRVMREASGEVDSTSSSGADNDDSDDDKPPRKEKRERKEQSSGASELSLTSAGERSDAATRRPKWLESDEEWGRGRVNDHSHTRNSDFETAAEMIFYQNIDPEDMDRVMLRVDPNHSRPQRESTSGDLPRVMVGSGSPAPSTTTSRPVWAEPDEHFDL